MTLRAETKARARALQLLYAWELQQRRSIRAIADELAGNDPRSIDTLERGSALAEAVTQHVEALDEEISRAAVNWRLDRIGIVERNILRLGVHELESESVPPRVAINEAVQLAHWFAGSKAPAFVNGVLDTIAHQFGRL